VVSSWQCSWHAAARLLNQIPAAARLPPKFDAARDISGQVSPHRCDGCAFTVEEDMLKDEDLNQNEAVEKR
jgi:hypothetical protein